MIANAKVLDDIATSTTTSTSTSTGRHEIASPVSFTTSSSTSTCIGTKDNNPSPPNTGNQNDQNNQNIPNQNNNGHKTDIDDDLTHKNIIIGGGSINEKPRQKNNTEKHKIQTENNDKSRDSYDPLNELSHLLHAVVGLDRYPSYLSRWNQEEDVEALEIALEKTLQKVRLQRESNNHRKRDILSLLQTVKKEETEINRILHKNDRDCCNDQETIKIMMSILQPPKTWNEVRNILHPSAVKAIFGSKMFQPVLKTESKLSNAPISSRSNPYFKSNSSQSPLSSPPSLEEVLNGNVVVELDHAMLEQWLDEEMEDVYSIRLLSPDFCIKLQRVLAKIIETSQTPKYNHLSLGKRPVDMDTIQMSWLNDLLLHLIVRPISRLLFRPFEYPKGDLDWRQGYVAGYSPHPSGDKDMAQRTRLVSHTDDSEVTLNLCLGDDTFTGGNILFRGLRGTKYENQPLSDQPFSPIIGTALLHAGRRMHEVTQVYSGHRYAYILWCRSWGSIRANTCPCCWLNRRQNHDDANNYNSNNCICGPRWN